MNSNLQAFPARLIVVAFALPRWPVRCHKQQVIVTNDCWSHWKPRVLVGQALNRQVAVLHARYKLTVEADLDGEPDLSLEGKEALYRIAQEALHNIVKHASSVILQLARQENEIILEVRDNGRGFDPTGPFPGHLSVRSMQERASKVGGTLLIESALGQGASIHVRVPRRDMVKS